MTMKVPRKKLRQLLKHKEAGKAHYQAADVLLDELLPLLEVGKAYEFDGRSITIVDNYSKNGQPINKSWKPCGINRFDLKIGKAAPSLGEGVS